MVGVVGTSPDHVHECLSSSDGRTRGVLHPHATYMRDVQRACGHGRSTSQGSPHPRLLRLLHLLLRRIRMGHFVVLMQGVLPLTLVDVVLTEVVI